MEQSHLDRSLLSASVVELAIIIEEINVKTVILIIIISQPEKKKHGHY